MDSSESLPGTLSWQPTQPLTVVIADADVVEFGENLRSDFGFWCFQNRLSANGIHIDAKAEKDWVEDRNAGTAWVGMTFSGYNLACNLRRDTARDVAAGLLGESSITVPVLFNCEPEDEDWLPDPVVVYFTAERRVAGVVEGDT